MGFLSNFFDRFTGSQVVGKYHEQVANLPNDLNPYKTIDDIISELDSKYHQDFENLLRFHAREALSRGDVNANATLSAYATYVKNL